MKEQIDIIIDEGLTNDAHVLLSNISPEFSDDRIIIRGRVNLTEEYNVNKNRVIIRGEILDKEGFILERIADYSIQNLKSKEDVFEIDCCFKFYHLIDKMERISKIRIYPVIYEREPMEHMI